MAEPYIIKMPQLSDTMTEGVVVSWEKNIGDKVERGDTVATVETDKAVMDVEVFREGYLSGPLAEIDSVVPVGEPIAYLVDSPDQAVDETRVAGTAASAKPSEETPRHAAASHPVPGHKPPTPHVDTGDSKPAPRPDNKHASPYARKLAGALHVNLNLSRIHISAP